jgi:general secretion pathway protein K
MTVRALGQRGAAILAAMLTVTLVATFAAAAMWQQYRSVEVEAAERSRVQSTWILTGALDWSRLILREDGRSGNAVDHLAEPWAIPLQEARLSTFLAADKSGAAEVSADADTAFLSGQIIDLQSRLNVNSLLDAGGAIAPNGLRAFQRLFEVLGLPAAQLSLLAENLRFASDTSTDNRSAAQAPLLPQRVEQLTWLGLTQETVTALMPHVTLLPIRQTPVNLNTASAEVIYAAGNGISQADAQRLVAERAGAHFRTNADADRLLAPAQAFDATLAGVSSRYFEVNGRLRLDQTVVEERSLVSRTGTTVTTLQRERGIAGASAVPAGQPLR